MHPEAFINQHIHNNHYIYYNIWYIIINRRYETGKEGNFAKLVISKKMCNLSVQKQKACSKTQRLQ